MEEGQGGRRGLTTRILFGMLAGFAVGLLLNAIGEEGFVRDVLIDGVFHVGGAIFLASLKLLVVPLVFVSIVCGTAALDDVTKLGRVGARTLFLYLATTAVAISLALTAAVAIAPGEGFELTTSARFTAQEPPSLTDTLINVFPSNPVRAMAEGNMLQIIVFAVLFGLAMTLSGEPGKKILALMRDLNAVVLRLVMLLMAVAPIGVFCLIANVFAVEGLTAIVPLAKYFTVVLGVLVFHALVT